VPAELLLRLAEASESTVLIDHHPAKTITGSSDPAALLPTHPDLKIVLDDSRSACLAVWNFFNKNQPVPWALDYVDDRDRWLFHLPESRAINAAMWLFANDHRNRQPF
jgi:oligoribonuclease NrnB/cAMP/cGMP phosphodiesterase (DHH superfamily)